MRFESGSDRSLEQQLDLKTEILSTADKRFRATSTFLEDHKITLPDFAKSLTMSPFKIEMDIADPKSIVGGIFDLQEKLGLAKKDYAKGCDGVYGGFTDYKFKKFLLKEKTHADLEKITDEGTGNTVVVNRLHKKYDVASVRAVGDSLMVGVGGFIAMSQSKSGDSYEANLYTKVGRQLAPLRGATKRKGNEAYAIHALNDPECELLLVNGGANDLDVHINNDPNAEDTSEKTAQRIIDSFHRIVEIAHANGKAVAIFLLHGLKHDKGNSVKGQRIQHAVEIVNAWLTQNSGADLLIDPNKLNEASFSKKDGLHWNTKATRQIAENFIGALNT